MQGCSRSVDTRTSVSCSILQVWLPDARSRMSPAMTCFYNDASWLDAGDMRMVHPQIDNRTAEILGCKSLRIQHQVGLCPNPSSEACLPSIGYVLRTTSHATDLMSAEHASAMGMQAIVRLDPEVDIIPAGQHQHDSHAAM